MTSDSVEPGIDKSHTRRRPWLAALLSLAFAGMGLLYCGRKLFAAANLAFTVAIFALVYVIMFWGPAWMLRIWLPWGILLVVGVGNSSLAWMTARRHNSQNTSCDTSSWLSYVIFSVVAVGAIASVEWLMGLPKVYKVPSAAMEDALQVDDRFIAKQSAYRSDRPEIGDLVIFLWPGDGITQYIKRCVALPGDTIEIRDTILYVNGVPQANPPTVKFIDSYGHRLKTARIPTFLGQDLRDYFGPYVVPPDCYFMLGDNRDNSSDSRVWGPVRHDLLLGKAVRIISSPDPTRVGTYLSDKVFAE